ncbi:MAG: hypothetical protein AUH25_03920 [Thaumarchaeota archaeon 13_1_40CM_38_12]|nr:MAG: hypothetical protein AUH25_03920 [Thaumarchaeota archaeon 13_1_40CM_38_12]
MEIDNKKVEEITRNFLQQQHGVYNIKVTGLENGIWVVEADTSSSSGERVRKLRIDGKTGKIISLE